MLIGLRALLALTLVELHGPGGQLVEINPESIVSIREPRENQTEHFQKDVKCLVFTSDGKFTAVTEDCEEVAEKMARIAR